MGSGFGKAQSNSVFSLFLEHKPPGLPRIKFIHHPLLARPEHLSLTFLAWRDYQNLYSAFQYAFTLVSHLLSQTTAEFSQCLKGIIGHMSGSVIYSSLFSLMLTTDIRFLFFSFYPDHSIKISRGFPVHLKQFSSGARTRISHLV